MRRVINNHRRESERSTHACSELVERLQQNKLVIQKLKAQNADMNLRCAESEKDQAVAAALGAGRQQDLERIEQLEQDRLEQVKNADEQAEQLALDTAVLKARQEQLEAENTDLKKTTRRAQDEVEGLRSQRAQLLRQLSEVTAGVATEREDTEVAKKKAMDNKVKKAEKKAQEARVQAETLEKHCEELEGALTRIAGEQQALDKQHARATRRATVEMRALMAVCVLQLVALLWSML
jgi:chromosome segregation ATPase